MSCRCLGRSEGCWHKVGPPLQGTPCPSPRLRALAGEIQRGNAAALDTFWRDVQGKTPLVEDIPGTPNCGASHSSSARACERPAADRPDAATAHGTRCTSSPALMCGFLTTQLPAAALHLRIRGPGGQSGSSTPSVPGGWASTPSPDCRSRRRRNGSQSDRVSQPASSTKRPSRAPCCARRDGSPSTRPRIIKPGEDMRPSHHAGWRRLPVEHSDADDPRQLAGQWPGSRRSLRCLSTMSTRTRALASSRVRTISASFWQVSSCLACAATFARARTRAASSSREAVSAAWPRRVLHWRTPTWSATMLSQSGIVLVLPGVAAALTPRFDTASMARAPCGVDGA